MSRVLANLIKRKMQILEKWHYCRYTYDFKNYKRVLCTTFCKYTLKYTRKVQFLTKMLITKIGWKNLKYFNGQNDLKYFNGQNRWS